MILLRCLFPFVRACNLILFGIYWTFWIIIMNSHLLLILAYIILNPRLSDLVICCLVCAEKHCTLLLHFLHSMFIIIMHENIAAFIVNEMQHSVAVLLTIPYFCFQLALKRKIKLLLICVSLFTYLFICHTYFLFYTEWNWTHGNTLERDRTHQDKLKTR